MHSAVHKVYNMYCISRNGHMNGGMSSHREMWNIHSIYRHSNPRPKCLNREFICTLSVCNV